MSQCGYTAPNRQSGSASEIPYDFFAPTRSPGLPLANRTKARHPTPIAGFATPEQTASAAQSEHICDIVRHFASPYLRGGHGRRRNAWHAQCDVDSWSCTPCILAPARAMRPIGRAHLGHGKLIEIHDRARKK